MPPTVLLLHSGGMSSRQWRKLADRLGGVNPEGLMVRSPSDSPTEGRGIFRVVMPDFLGSGSNPPWPDAKPFHFGLDLDMVDGMIDGPFHGVGHSYGGLIALLLARRRPHDVRSLTLYDPVAFGILHAARDPEGLADLARAGKNPIFTDDTQGGTEPWWRVFIDYWNGPGSWEDLPEPARMGFLRVGRKVYQEVRTLMTERSGAETYAVIDAPTLLLTGEKSPVAARRLLELLSHSLPNSRLRRVDGAGHMGPITHADVVNDLIVEHLLRAREESNVSP